MYKKNKNKKINLFSFIIKNNFILVHDITIFFQRPCSFLRRFAFSSSHPPMAGLKCRCSGALRHGRMALSSSHEPPMPLRHPPALF